MNRQLKLNRGLVCLILIIIPFVIPLFTKEIYTFHILISVGMNIILATTLRLILISGQLSLAHGGVMCVGAYTSALLVIKLGISTWLAIFLAGLATLILAFLVGFPFVRLKGIYFAIITIFLGEMIILIGEQWKKLTGGSLGILNIPRLDPLITPGGVTLNFDSKIHFYYLILILSISIFSILYSIEHSRIGLTWKGIRQADFLAESIGINTTKYKVYVFAISCFFVGIIGGFYSHYMTVVSPRTFGFLFTIYPLVYMVAGGMEKFSGPILGATILTILPEIFRPLKEFQPFIFSVILMLIIFFLPEGLIGLPKRIIHLVSEKDGNA